MNNWKSTKAPTLKGDIGALIDFQNRLYAGVEKNGVTVFNTAADAWEPTKGLEGKSVLTFQACGSKLFAGTLAFGVYHYISEKNQWVPMNQGLFKAHKGPPPKGDVTGESPPDCVIDQCLYSRDVYGLACDAQDLYAVTDQAVYVTSLKKKRWKQVWGPISGLSAITFFGEDLYVGRNGGADACGIYKIKTGTSVIKDAPQEAGCRMIIDLISFKGDLFASDSTQVLLKKKGGPEWEIVGKDMDYVKFEVCKDQLYGMTSFAGELLQGRTFQFHEGTKIWRPYSKGIPEEEANSFASANSKIYAGTKSGKMFVLECY